VVDDASLRVCLSRSLEVTGATLYFRDWPGLGRAIVCFALDFDPAPALAATLAPRHRVVSLSAREAVSYQTDAADLAAFLRTFGFEAPILVSVGLGALAPLLVAAWWPSLVGALLLVAPVREAAAGLAGRGLRECPPDWDALLALVCCPVRLLDSWSASAVEELLLGATG
jgi:pimeloyl-ACP methyl ester carboxylesterase